MLYGVKKLTKENFQLARRKGARTFLYNEVEFDCKEFEKDSLVFYNCSQDRIESTWYTWEQNERIYKVFREKFKHLFVFGKYDLGLACQKALYWSNQKTGFLNYARKVNFPTHPVLFFETLYPYAKSKILIKYALALLSSLIKKNDERLKQTHTNSTAGVFIKQAFQLTLYKHLVGKMKGDNTFVFFVYQDEVGKGLMEMGVEENQIIRIPIPPNLSKPNFRLNLFKIKNDDWYVLNQLLIHQKEIAMWCYIGETIASSGIKKLLMNEAENGIMGAVLGEIMNKNNIVSFNTMNGMKSGQAQDYFINFDKWFVWDELMAKLLSYKKMLNPNKFIITGHLMQDELLNYKYNNSLGLENSKLEGKKVISLFSIRGEREEKIETLEMFKRIMLDKDNDIYLIIRPHPSEMYANNFKEFEYYENVKIVKYSDSDSKTTLYDQLYISDLSICFGSTVALESKWFNVPCISYEKREKSLIYMIDNELISHVKDLNGVLNCICKTNKIQEGAKKKFTVNKSVADCIKSEIHNSVIRGN